MTLLEYIKKVNVGFDELSPAEQMRIILSFLSKYLVVQSYYVEVDGQRYRLNLIHFSTYRGFGLIRVVGTYLRTTPQR